MKRILALIICATLIGVVNAQVKTPAPSPSQVVKQALGLSKIEVNYSRPGVKDREIFGKLVPFDKMWRTGANGVTTIKVKSKVMFEGKELKKGTYAFLTIPGKDKWTIVVNSNTKNNAWAYDDATEVFRIDVKPVTSTEKVENFTIGFDNLTDASCTMQLKWANTVVPIKVTVNTEEAVMATIDKTLAGPSAGDYYTSAKYYFQKDKDLEKALEWIEKSSTMAPDKFWVEKWYAEILAANGDKKKAIEVATKSIELAETAGNKEYVKFNKDNIAKWSK